MKRVALILLLVSLVVTGAAAAGRIDPPDGTLIVKNGVGRVVIIGKGAVIGRFDSGFVQIRDSNPNDGTGPIVTGADSTRDINDRTTRYFGTDVRFRIIGGAFAVIVIGTNIDLSMVGKGQVMIVGRGTQDDGSYSVNGGPSQPVPFPVPDTFSLATPHQQNPGAQQPGG